MRVLDNRDVVAHWRCKILIHVGLIATQGQIAVTSLCCSCTLILAIDDLTRLPPLFKELTVASACVSPLNRLFCSQATWRIPIGHTSLPGPQESPPSEPSGRMVEPTVINSRRNQRQGGAGGIIIATIRPDTCMCRVYAGYHMPRCTFVYTYVQMQITRIENQVGSLVLFENIKNL